MTLDILPAFVGSLILAVYLTRFFFLKLKAKTPLFLGSELDRRKKRTLVVLGSGGHTTEMLRLLDHMQKEIYNPRYYFLANTDHMSIKKLKLRSVREFFLHTNCFGCKEVNLFELSCSIQDCLKKMGYLSEVTKNFFLSENCLEIDRNIYVCD